MKVATQLLLFISKIFLGEIKLHFEEKSNSHPLYAYIKSRFIP